MPYSKRDLVELTGLGARTIRTYCERGLIPRPRGHGLGAEYDEEHLVRALTIARMRASGTGLDAIAEEIAGWTTAKFKRYVADTAPPPSAPPGGLPPPTEPPPMGASPFPIEPIVTASLPAAPAWRIYSLLTGIGLMVDVDAPPVVHRIAAEILAKYGRSRAP
jgi:MerR HTH family regulatory protein